MFAEIDTGTPEYLRQKLDDAKDTIAHLERFVDFVNLWCNRDSKISDTERVSVIKFHPIAQAALKQRPVAP